MNKYIVIFSLLFVMAFQAKAEDAGPLNLLIHPFLDKELINKRFSPLVHYLSKQIGIEINIKISSRYSSHIDEIGLDHFDLAYIGPYAFVKMSQLYGEKPILGRLEVRGRPVFKGKIITRIDSPIRKIKDLKGKKFAFGDASSTMAYIVPKAVLEYKGVGLNDFSSFQHYSNHSAVIKSVLNGEADAGAVKEEMYYKNMERLKAIASTPEISEHLFIANNELPPKLIKKIKKALLQMHQDRDGLIAMRAIKLLMTGVVKAEHKDYQNLSNIYLNEQKSMRRDELK